MVELAPPARDGQRGNERHEGNLKQKEFHYVETVNA